MKLRYLVLCISLVTLARTVDAHDENPFFRNLPFENGEIHYEISGMEEGTETLYVRNYGERTATYRKTVTSMMGMKVQTNTLEITDSQWVYSYDLDEKSGVKSVNPLRLMVEEYEKLSGTDKTQVLKNAALVGMNAMISQGGEVEQFAARILGYDCDKSSTMGVTVYAIHGSSLPLMTESDLMGMKMDMVATSLAKGKVEDKYFQHPAGIRTIYDQESEVMARYMARQTIAWLKEPQRAGSPRMQVIQPDPTRHGQGDGQQAPEEQQPMQEAMALLKRIIEDHP